MPASLITLTSGIETTKTHTIKQHSTKLSCTLDTHKRYKYPGGSMCQYLKFSILLLRRDFILGIICLFSKQQKDLYLVCCSIMQNKVLNTSNRFNSDHKNSCWLYSLPVYSRPSLSTCSMSAEYT